MLGNAGKAVAAALALLAGSSTLDASVTSRQGSSTGSIGTAAAELPSIDSWLNVFDEEFDGQTFNGQPIVDEVNTGGDTSSPDGLDDRVWLPNRFTSPESISLTPTAPGGDPGNPADGYLNLRTFRAADGTTKSPDWLTTGSHLDADGRRGLFESTYGYVEARVKMVRQDGVMSAFFLYSRDHNWWNAKPSRDPAAAGVELDIFEEADDPASVTHNLHWDGYGDVRGTAGTDGSRPCPNSPCEGNFHTFGVLWTPSDYRYFIDRQEIRVIDQSVSHHPLYLILGNTVDRPGYDFGPLNDPRNARMIVDYVKIWQPAVSNIRNQETQRNVPLVVPFTVSHAVSEDPRLPVPRVARVDVGSSNPNVVRNTDLKIAGTGADRTITVMPRSPGGQAGTTTILLVARDAAGRALGSDTFDVTVKDPAGSVVGFAPGALPNLGMGSSGARSLAFSTPTTEGSAPVVTVTATNEYLLPPDRVGLVGTGRTWAVSVAPLPTRTGTSDVTVVVTDPADGSTTSDTFQVTVNHGRLKNTGFETGASPWEVVGDGSRTSSAAQGGTYGFHVEAGLVKQRFPVQPNTTYALGGWGRVGAVGGLVEFGIWDTHTYPDGDKDGRQPATVMFDSIRWTRKEVVFTTGRHTQEVEVFANNFVPGGGVAFDLDNVSLADGPELTQVPDQSIGHGTCVRPTFWVGRVGLENDLWTVTAAVTAGDPTLIAGLAVEAPDPRNRYERALRITPTADQTRSGEVTITITVTDRAGLRRTDDVRVWVNAGSFRNGSFERPHADDAEPVPLDEPIAYPGCAEIPAAWDGFFSPKATVISGFDWMRGFRNYGLELGQVQFGSGEPFGDVVAQDVTGLEPNTEYVVSAAVDLWTWPDTNATVPDGASLEVSGPGVTLLAPTSGVASRTRSGWEQLSVRFRTGSDGVATVWLRAPNHPTYKARFHDVTVLAAT